MRIAQVLRLIHRDNIAVIILCNGRYVFMNDAAVALYGRRRRDLIGKSSADFSPEFQPGRIPSAKLAGRKLATSKSTGKPLLFEWDAIFRNGPTKIWVALQHVASINGMDYSIAIKGARREEVFRSLAEVGVLNDFPGLDSF